MSRQNQYLHLQKLIELSIILTLLLIASATAPCIAQARNFACPMATASQETVCSLDTSTTFVAPVGYITSPSVRQQWAQTFTTGATTDEYGLQSVQIAFSYIVGTPGNLTVAIHEQAAGGSVGDLVGTLSGGNPTANELHTFPASGITLTARTTYFVVLSAPMAQSSFNWYYASVTDSTTQTGNAGWSLGDKLHLQRGSAAWTEVEEGFVLSIAIIATPTLKLKLRVLLESALP